MTNVPRSSDDTLDDLAQRQLTPDERVSERWARAIERANRGRGLPLALPSPIDVMPEILRVRGLPQMPWPPQWPGLARRCRTYPGDMVSVVGPTGAGKTQFAIQVGISFAAAGRGCVLWAPLELAPVDIDLRIVANRAGVNEWEVREDWPIERISAVLAAVTDRWRYVDRLRVWEAQIAAIDEAVDLALQVYGAPPLLIVDYMQKAATGAENRRAAIADASEGLRELTMRRGCYTMALSQGGRGIQQLLTGKISSTGASDTLGAGAESSEIENASATTVELVVFKADDSPVLDAHWHVSKARRSGGEGREGARYTKRGGVWTELDHLPATPAEVDAEVKRARKTEAPRAPADARSEINGVRAEEAASRRREAIVAALRAAGHEGIGTRDLRRVKGTGSAARMNETLEELERGGRARRSLGRWVLVN